MGSILNSCRKILKSWPLIIALFCLAFGYWSYFYGTEYAINRIEAVAECDTINKTSTDTARATIIEQNGQKGDTFGGTLGPLIAIVAAGLTFLAFWVQYAANKEQRKDIRLERFENRFFKFIDYHRENVALMRYRNPNRGKDEQDYLEGNRVFARMYYDICTLLDKYGASELEYPQQKQDAINFVYNCIFFGAREEGLKIVKEKFEHNNAIPEDKLEKFLNIKHEIFAGVMSKYNDDIPFYSSHARRLGHYFRNLYQAVYYVDNQDFLSEDEKYEYVSVLRAQMSVYEQCIFFFNSLSDLGSTWEWDMYKRENPASHKKNEVFQKLWITKFDFVRNTAREDGDIAQGIRINDFYPLLNPEGKHECTRYGVLPFSSSNGKNICRYCFNRKYIGNVISDTKSKIRLAEETGQFSKKFECDEPGCKTTAELKKIRT